MKKQLKAFLKSLEGLSAEDAAYYIKLEDGSGYELDTDRYFSGITSTREKEKLELTELKQRLEALGKATEGLDLEAARKALAEQEQQKKKKLIEEGKVDELIAQRVQAMQADHAKVVDELNKQIASLTAHLETAVVDSAFRLASTEAKVRPTAVEDVLLRAKRVFKVQDGKAVALNEEGKVIYGKDPNIPLTPKEWLEALKPTAVHLFEETQGTGKHPAGGGPKIPPSGGQEGVPLSPTARLIAARQKQGEA